MFAAWFPFLKEYAIFLIIGTMHFATRGCLWLYQRHQLLHNPQNEEGLSQQRPDTLLHNGISGLVIALLLLILYCFIQVYSSSRILPILGIILVALFGTALMTGLIILFDRSKWRTQK